MKTGDAVREDKLGDLSRERRTILPKYRGECNMKITFFKNESQFYPRRSYLWTNAEKVDVDFKFKRLRKHSQLLFVIPLVIFLTFLRFGSDCARIVSRIVLLAFGKESGGHIFLSLQTSFFFCDGICKTCLRRMEQNASGSVLFISDYSTVICPCDSSSFYFIFENMVAVSFGI